MPKKKSFEDKMDEAKEQVNLFTGVIACGSTFYIQSSPLKGFFAFQLSDELKNDPVRKRQVLNSISSLMETNFQASVLVEWEDASFGFVVRNV